MFFRSFFDENLAQMSYLVGCQRTGEAIVMDPARDIAPYERVAKQEGLTIIAAAETHIHADYLSGAREIAERFAAKLYLSDEGDKNWKYEYVAPYAHSLLKDRDTFNIGRIEFEVMHTPGHTPESISFILTDHGSGSTAPMGVFTGDFVFVGDVGRPDLLEKAAGIANTAKIGASQMYQSIQRFKELPDFLQVWPAHGAGSACGKSLGAVPMSTIGYEKINNWAFTTKDELEFIDTLLSGQPEPPRYFAMMKKLNKEGPALTDNRPIKQLEHASELTDYMQDAVLLDTRHAQLFGTEHYAGSINIPFNSSFTNWAGWILDYDTDIVLLAPQADIENIRRSLSSIGLDQIIAFMEPQVALADTSNLESYEEISVAELRALLTDSSYQVIDVRNQSEWDGGRIKGTTHHMLGTLKDQLQALPKDKQYVVHCRSGARSAIAASIMQANGIKDVKNVKGGYLAWTKEKYPVIK